MELTIGGLLDLLSRSPGSLVVIMAIVQLCTEPTGSYVLALQVQTEDELKLIFITVDQSTLT